MFGDFNFGDLAGMMGKAQEFKAKMEEAQAKLTTIYADAEVGGVYVKAAADNRIVDVQIRGDIQDKEELADLMMAATNKALEKAQALGAQFVKKSTEGIMPNLPGLGF